METLRKPYPSYVSDEEWVLVASYLTLLPEDAGQRTPARVNQRAKLFKFWSVPLWVVLPHLDIGGEFGAAQLGRERVQLRKGGASRLRLRFVRQPSQ